MSRKAGIGKLAPEQMAYLTPHGIDEQKAISLLIRSFPLAAAEGLGAELDAQITKNATIADRGKD